MTSIFADVDPFYLKAVISLVLLAIGWLLLTQRKGRRAPLDDDDGYRRPLDAPDMPTECPVCFESLFSEQGIADKPIAKIMCSHLVHSECLGKAGQALNSNGSRYGISGLGPRGGCPVCGKPVSFWMTYKKAADFPVFWMHRIQKCLELIGPDQGPVPVNQVKSMIRNDDSLSDTQKEYLDYGRAEDSSGRLGFPGALADGDHVWTDVDVNGGPSQGGYISSVFRKGVWDYNKESDTLWLHKWDA